MESPAAPTDKTRTPLLRPIDPEEQARRNRETIALLESFLEDDDEQDQREAMEALRESLGPRRIASSRTLFP